MRLFFIIFSIFVFANFSSADEYRFLSGPKGGNWSVLGGEISRYFTQNGINTQNVAGRGISNIVNINNDGADIGFSVGSLVGAAVKGDYLFEGFIKNVEVLANMYPQITYFIVREDFAKKYNINTLKDALNYKKLRIASLKSGSSSEFILSTLFRLGYKKSWADIKRDGKVIYTTYVNGAKLLEENKVDMFAFSVGEDAKIIKDMQSKTDIKILPVDKSILTKLSNYYGTRTYILKPNSYKCVKKFTPTIGDYTVLIVNKNLPKNIIRNMTKILLSKKYEIAKKVSSFSKFNARSAISTTLPMNSTSRAYFGSKR